MRRVQHLLRGVVVLMLAGTMAASSVSGSVTGVPAIAGAAECGGPEVERDPTPVELELLTIVNAYREARGLSALVPSPSLMRAARWKAADLAATTTGLIDTADLDDPGRSWAMRLVDCGYPSTAGVGETLGQVPGAADPTAVLELWLGEEANARLLNDPAWRAAGVAAVETRDYTFWVLDLGATRL